MSTLSMFSFKSYFSPKRNGGDITNLTTILPITKVGNKPEEGTVRTTTVAVLGLKLGFPFPNSQGKSKMETISDSCNMGKGRGTAGSPQK